MPHTSRVALITGCGKPVGIGNSTARALAAKGVAIVVSDIRPAGIANEHNAPGDLDANWGGVDSLVEQIEKAGGTAMAVLGDVSREADAGRMVEEVLSRYGRLDILVNNAGGADVRDDDGDALGGERAGRRIADADRLAAAGDQRDAECMGHGGPSLDGSPSPGFRFASATLSPQAGRRISGGAAVK